MSEAKIERREFVKRAAYTVPIILTLKAAPAFAAQGSGKSRARTKKELPDESREGTQGKRGGR